MQGIAKQKSGMKYILIVIDVFSKFAMAIAVHSKNAEAITAAFGQVLITTNSRHSHWIHTDKIKKFLNTDF